MSRQRIQIVEVDLDYCTLTYGTSPCTAILGGTGPRKCFNGYATCQDRTNYDAGTLTLRFAQNQQGLPKGQTIFPCLAGEVSKRESSVNLGALDDKRGPLGRRARVEVRLKDFAYVDTYTDKYATGRIDGTADTTGAYRPNERGTFFGKLASRFPYYPGRSLRVKEGVVGDDIANMRTENYVITEWVGPDANGNVTITAKDILDLADDDKAKAPAPSRGNLATEITEVDSLPTFRLTPETVGDEYPSSGRALIGSEIVSYTRSGDEITITARGLDGSEASTHDEGDTFQAALRFENAPIHEVLRDLLRDYAGIPSDFIPFQDWRDESERWLAGYNLTATIAKPEGVTTLVGELLGLGVLLWWDAEAQQLRFRADRPLDLGEEAAAITDDLSIVEKSAAVKDLYDQRLTQVHFYHGVLDYSKSVTDTENFRRVVVSVDLDAESDLEYGETRIFEGLTRWLGDGNESIANSIAGRKLARFRNTPKQVQFGIDYKDRASVGLAGLLRLTSHVIQDVTGASASTQMQVSEVREAVAGHLIRVTAETFRFDQKLGFIMPSAANDYGSATDDEKATGCYIVNGTRLEFGDGEPPYLIY